MNERGGFTLIELAIVVAIVGILAALALPNFSATLARAQAATTKGNLGALRTAIGMYTGAKEGVPPPTLEDLMPQYLNSIPSTYTPGLHAPNNDTDVPVAYSFMGEQCIKMNPESSSSDPGGGWMYRFPTAGIINNGVFSGYCAPASVVVDCSHRDARGVVWADY